MLCDSETVCCVSVMAHCVLAQCRVVLAPRRIVRSCFRATVHLSEHNVALTQMALSGHLSQQTVWPFCSNVLRQCSIC